MGKRKWILNDANGFDEHDHTFERAFPWEKERQANAEDEDLARFDMQACVYEYLGQLRSAYGIRYTI